jgi:methionine synthase / methylenetetrahydrofolate reductase(NADPH)
MSMETMPASRAQEFREALGSGVLVADGAMGTMLYEKGVFINRCYDELNLSTPAIVREVHEAYVKAGAQILETNTFGAKPDPAGGVRDGGEVAGNQPCRGAVGAGGGGGPGVCGGCDRARWVCASSRWDRRVSRKPGRCSGSRWRRWFSAGVDLLVFETFYQLNELREALFAAQEVTGGRMAVVAQVTINDDGNMLDGTDTETFAKAMNEWPCDVIGLNCSVGPKATLETLEKITTYTKKPLSAMPNAGTSGGGGGAEDLPVLAGVYVAVCAAVPLGGGEDHRRVLRDDAGAH